MMTHHRNPGCGELRLSFNGRTEDFESSNFGSNPNRRTTSDLPSLRLIRYFGTHSEWEGQ
jgi:hypothetical protein